uniref:Uncharacterized protein n=1 Tax=Caenorhabditis japonica TaxID=281687 RepID=A0A8R1I505_CAEJA
MFALTGQNRIGLTCSLCWLATTEWLVSFERGTDHDAYLMRCKKDKPVEWMQYHELSYTSSKWPLPSQLFPSTQLLVDWNVVLIGNSKTSEIVTVGKRDDWQAWVPIDEDGIYLPTTADSRDTVPVGITVDRTATEDVFLTPDGSQKHRPSPLVLCLTNDGVLTTHHVISTFPAHKPCQIQSQNIPITGLSKLQLAPPTVQKALPELSAQKSKVEAAPVTPVPAALFGGAAKPVTTPISAKIPAPVTPNSDKNAEQLNLNLKKKTFIERIQKTRQTIKSSKEEIIKMSLAVQNAKSLVHECAEVVKCSVEDSKGVIEELNNLISSMECIGERTKHTVKELDFEIEEKMELISDVDDGENILEKLRDLSETERMMRFNKLETSADMLKEKFVECAEAVKLLKKALVEKESLRKQSVLSPLRHNSTLNQLSCGAETDVALKVMRNVSKIILDTRERIQRAELEFLHFQRAANNQKEHNQSVSTIARSINNITVRETEENNERNNLSDAEAIKARKALVARIQKRGVVKTKNVTVESYWKTGAPALKNKEDPIDTSNLSNALLKLSMTPRRVMSTSSVLPSTPSVRRDATTQADEPPVVKTVVVTVESPARPVQTPPVSTTPALKTSTSTSTTTSTSPLAVPLAKPAETSSSIFSGSLTTAPKSSLFGNVAPKEEKKKIPEAAKVERIEEKEKETTKKETTVEEPKKVEEKAPEPAVTIEKEKEKKEDTVKSAPSFCK